MKPKANIPEPVHPKRTRPVLICTKRLFTCWPLNTRHMFAFRVDLFLISFSIFFKQKTKAYKRNKKLTNTLKNIYVIKSKNFKTNKKRLKMKTKRRKEKLNSWLRRSFVYLSRIPPYPFNVYIRLCMQTRKMSSIAWISLAVILRPRPRISFRLKTHTFRCVMPSVHTTALSVFIENVSIWKYSWKWIKSKSHSHRIRVEGRKQ